MTTYGFLSPAVDSCNVIFQGMRVFLTRVRFTWFCKYVVLPQILESLNMPNAYGTRASCRRCFPKRGVGNLGHLVMLV